MNLENIMLSEYVDSKKQQIKQKQTHRQREQTGGCQRRGEWEMGKIGEGDQEVETSVIK